MGWWLWWGAPHWRAGDDDDDNDYDDDGDDDDSGGDDGDNDHDEESVQLQCSVKRKVRPPTVKQTYEYCIPAQRIHCRGEYCITIQLIVAQYSIMYEYYNSENIVFSGDEYNLQN